MHNCHRTQNILTDLIFDELPAAQKQRVIADIKACDECARQYTSLTETLALFDEAANAVLPESEDGWQRYNKRLRLRLDDSIAPRSQTSHDAQRGSFWRRALLMRVQIPVFALAAAVLVAVASLASLLLLRSPAAAVQRDDDSMANTRASVSIHGASTDSPVENPSKIIEVPVVRERIVTRVVYVHRRPAQEHNSNAARSTNHFEASEPEEQTLARAAAVSPRPPLAHLSLDGFQPTNDVKLTVIKAVEKDK